MKRYFEAFAYPLRRNNLGVMILGIVVLVVVPSVLSYVPMAGGALSLAINLLLTAYYAIFLRSILHASMKGDAEFPAWPDMEHPVTLFEDLFSIAMPFFVSFLPLILLRVSVSGLSALVSMGFIYQSALPAGFSQSSTGMAALSTALLIFGWLYLPMAILVWTYYGGTSILNPIGVLRSAWRTGPSYLLLVFLVAAMIVGAWSISLLSQRWLTSFSSSLLAFYALVVAMRMLGTHYQIHRKTLGWEEERTLPEPV